MYARVAVYTLLTIVCANDNNKYDYIFLHCDGYYVYAKCHIDGVPLTLLIDTGNPQCVLDRSRCGKLGGWDSLNVIEYSNGIKYLGLSIKKKVFMNGNTYDITFIDDSLKRINDHTEHFGKVKFDGILGLNYLCKRGFIIDLRYHIIKVQRK